MTRILDRYAGAVRSGNLKSEPGTTYSDSDVLGAAGLASRRSPLGMALLRLFVGDDHAGEVVDQLTAMAVGKAYRMGQEITRPWAADLARAVLAWYRHGTCTACGGHGVRVIPGTTTLGSDPCRECRGRGRIDLDRAVPIECVELARWLAAEIDREQAIAGVEAMRSLAPRLDL